MSKTKLVVPMIAVWAFLTGCANVASLHPLAVPGGPETVDAALLGTWEDPNDGAGDRTTFTIARAGSGYTYQAIAGSDEPRRYLLPYASDERSFGEECQLRRITPKNK